MSLCSKTNYLLNHLGVFHLGFVVGEVRDSVRVVIGSEAIACIASTGKP